MEAVVKKWGNSLAIRIPNNYAKDIHIHEGTIIDIERIKETLTIKPHKKSLTDYLKNISSNNIHCEISSDGPVGNEVW